MDLPKEASSPRTPSSQYVQWRRWAALAILTACGGTTGLENIDAGNASSLDATSLGTDTSISANSPVGADSAVGVDSQVGAESSAGIDVAVADDSGYDRTVPGRPPAGDTGVPPATNNDSGGPTPLGTDGGPDGGGPLPTTLQVLAAVTGDSISVSADGSIIESDAADAALPPCVACSNVNGCLDPTLGNGSCETIQDSGMPQMPFGGELDAGVTCATLGLGTGVSETTICLQTLAQIFSTRCGESLQLTPCLCGTTDPSQCAAGTALPNGALYDTYACDFGTTSGSTIMTDFILQSYGAGMANAIVECLQSFATTSSDCCVCNGVQPQTCAQQNVACGQATDGCGNTIDCGSCPAPQECAAGKCCTPLTCAQQNIACGQATDGCGLNIGCGTCPTGQKCTNGQCG